MSWPALVPRQRLVVIIRIADGSAPPFPQSIEPERKLLPPPSVFQACRCWALTALSRIELPYWLSIVRGFSPSSLRRIFPPAKYAIGARVAILCSYPFAARIRLLYRYARRFLSPRHQFLDDWRAWFC